MPRKAGDESDLGRGNTEIAGECQTEPAACGHAVECGNDRFGNFADHGNGRMQDRHHFLNAWNNTLLCQRFDKEFNIAAATKCLAVAGENNRPHLGIIPALHQGFAQAG